MGRFDGKIVLVTGAAGGFGRRTAERFAADGARLVMSDLEGGSLDALAASLGAGTAALAGDISDETFVRGSWSGWRVKRFGRLDIAINNAGIVQRYRAPAADIPAEEARRVIAVDLLAVFYAMKEQIPRHGAAIPRNRDRRRRSSTSPRSRVSSARRSCRSMPRPSTASSG